MVSTGRVCCVGEGGEGKKVCRSLSCVVVEVSVGGEWFRVMTHCNKVVSNSNTKSHRVGCDASPKRGHHPDFPI